VCGGEKGGGGGGERRRKRKERWSKSTHTRIQRESERESYLCTSLLRVSHRNRSSPQRWIVPHRNRRKEAVHIHMKDQTIRTALRAAAVHWRTLLQSGMNGLEVLLPRADEVEARRREVVG